MGYKDENFKKVILYNNVLNVNLSITMAHTEFKFCLVILQNFEC